MVQVKFTKSLVDNTHDGADFVPFRGSLMETRVLSGDAALLRSLMEVGVNLSVLEDRQTMLEMILREARKLTDAEAGTFYIFQGETLRFVAAQNERLSDEKISRLLLGKEIPTHESSLAGFAASTGQLINIPNSYELPEGAPFRIHREFDAATGYRAQSILAIPLTCPDGSCVGVLELINRIDSGGQIVPFTEEQCERVKILASMAAVSIYNVLLQDRLKQAQLDCIIRLSVAAEFRDDDTAAHIHRISRVSAIIASEMGLDRPRVELIRYASPMHDIGKIGLPDTILLKPGPLTPEERTIAQRHTLIGADILKDPPNELIAVAREVAVNHHEKFDGTGYPNGRAGKDIPLCARIVSLADVFDALISKRCYKEPFPLDEALELVQTETGKHFDGEVVEAMFNKLPAVLSHYTNPRESDRERKVG